MGNKGAFITMNGKDMKPHFTTYDAVVSWMISKHLVLANYYLPFSSPIRMSNRWHTQTQ